MKPLTAIFYITVFSFAAFSLIMYAIAKPIEILIAKPVAKIIDYFSKIA